MSLQRMFPFEPSKNPGETFEGWATESRQLSVSLRKMLAHRISERGGGYLPRLPTPTAMQYGYNTSPGPAGPRPSLGQMAKMGQWPKRLPTPTARDYKDGTAKSCQNVPINGLLGRAVHQLQEPTTGGKLSPLWVEWLMGWPVGWTDLNPLETDKCQWPQRPPGIS